MKSGIFDMLRIKYPGKWPLTPAIKKAARFTDDRLLKLASPRVPCKVSLFVRLDYLELGRFIKFPTLP
jgi:hypothetical protein